MTDFLGGWDIEPAIEHVGALLGADINELAVAPPLEFLGCPLGNDDDPTSLEETYLSLLAMKRKYGIGQKGTNATFQSCARRLAANMLATGKLCYYNNDPDALVQECLALDPGGTCSAMKIHKYARFYVEMTNLRRRMINRGPIKRPQRIIKSVARHLFDGNPRYANASEGDKA